MRFKCFGCIITYSFQGIWFAVKLILGHLEPNTDRVYLCVPALHKPNIRALVFLWFTKRNCY